eukprot:TRINITY_DN4775_c0_g1_i6.p2 TRINITY_DN4775_c0_g1~~TRINITY_DN4775_c0_g1_i6.p2  ORF type:complete len:161 (+),score=25.54 TRINITY_DN4775_c0_g1_i6:3-485(+)
MVKTKRCQPARASQPQKLDLSSDCSVRSLRRSSEGSGHISGIMVRLEDAQSVSQNGTMDNNNTAPYKTYSQHQSHMYEDDAHNIRHQSSQQQLLTRPQLELLVASSTVKSMLRDERLQEMIKCVDNCQDRMEGLEQMLVDKQFQKFVDVVLDLITPGSPQ